MKKNILQKVTEFLAVIETPAFVLDEQNILLAGNEKYCKYLGDRKDYERIREEKECTEFPIKFEDMVCTCVLVDENKNDDIDSVTKLFNLNGLGNIYKTLNTKYCYHYVCFEADDYLYIKQIQGDDSANEYLLKIWDKIRSVFPKEGFYFARIMAGQFLAMTNANDCDEIQLERYCRKVTEIFKRQSTYDTDKMETVINMGVLLNQPVSDVLDDILYKTKMALRRSKSIGESNYVVYNRIEKQLMEDKELEAAATEALARGEFVPYLQPKMNTPSNTLSGAEALVRWISPEKGFIMPGKFIPLMERNGFIKEIDFSILEQVCCMKKHWREEEKSYAHILISVNMSRNHFFDENFVDSVMEIIEKYETPTEEIELEITETVFFEKEEIIKDTISKLKEKGFYISIDDFGSGYSSLGMLKDVKADILKLDKKFIDNSVGNQKGIAVIRNVISMGEDLHMQIISEGVETEVEKDMLTQMGCEVIQGFYYSKPLSKEQFEVYADNTCSKKIVEVDFPLLHDAISLDGEEEGILVGEGVTFDDGAVFPGGDVLTNVIVLPNEVIASESYTISFWINPKVQRRWASAFFIRYRQGFMSLAPYVNKMDRMVYRIHDERAVHRWRDIVSDPIACNTWTHVAVTMDAKSRISRLYINGTMIHLLEDVPGMSNVEKVVLGGDYYQQSFEGRIRDLRIIESTQSSEQIRHIYEEGKNREDNS